MLIPVPPRNLIKTSRNLTQWPGREGRRVPEPVDLVLDRDPERLDPDLDRDRDPERPGLARERVDLGLARERVDRDPEVLVGLAVPGVLAVPVSATRTETRDRM